MSASFHRPRRRLSGGTNLGTTEPSGAAVPAQPASPQPAAPLDIGMLRALDECATMARSHPDHMGGVLAHLAMLQSESTYRVEKLVNKFLDQEGLELRDIEDVLPILDRVNVSRKNFLAFARQEYEMRRLHRKTEAEALFHLRSLGPWNGPIGWSDADEPQGDSQQAGPQQPNQQQPSPQQPGQPRPSQAQTNQAQPSQRQPNKEQTGQPPSPQQTGMPETSPQQPGSQQSAPAA